MNIFTYGSLMFDGVWSVVVSGTYRKTKARIYGYQRRGLRGEAYPALIPGRKNDHVDGIVYFNVDSNDRDRLDQFEGAYYKKTLEICKLPDNRSVPAQVYVFRAKYRALVDEEDWNPEWFEKIGIHRFIGAYGGYDWINDGRSSPDRSTVNFSRKNVMKKSLGAKTMVFPTPVWVVGTYDQKGRPNAMTAAWGGICCSKPPCIAVALQKPRFSYSNILEKKAFTISVPSEPYVRETDYFGIASGRNTDKFTATGLTPVRGKFVDAPYVAEFPLVLECRLVRTVEIGLHTQFIGEIMDVKADESVMGTEGLPDIEKVQPIVFGPEVRTYHGIGRYLGRAFEIGKDR